MKVENVLIVLAVILIAAGGTFLLFKGANDHAAEKTYEDIREAVSYPKAQEDHEDSGQSTDGGGEDDATQDVANVSEPTSDAPVIDWGMVLDSGKDIKGYLVFPALDISYPIVKGTDNSFYLNHTPDGSYRFAGSIFMDSENRGDFLDVNTVIYGHNMNSGSMFGKLKHFNKDAYNNCPYIWVCTPEKSMKYQIFSNHLAEAQGDSTFTFFDNRMVTDIVKNWVSSEHEKSNIGLPMPAEHKWRVISLCTCTGDSGVRRVVQAILIKEEKAGGE